MDTSDVTRLRPMDVNDLHLVRAWRNHPDIRQAMYSQHEISSSEHARWYENASKDPKRHLLLFEINAQPLGYINIHEQASIGIADWGFYTAPSAPKGTGRALGHAAKHYAFSIKKLHKLCGQALASNERSIRFHLRLGFQHEGTLRQQHFDGHQYQDIFCFGLLASQWQQTN